LQALQGNNRRVANGVGNGGIFVVLKWHIHRAIV
jgi:hypothetical protein